MESEEKDLVRQAKLKELWNDSKRYQQTRDEVTKALVESKGMPLGIPFYRKRYFAIAASIVILIGISAILIFIVQKPFSGSGNDNLSHGSDTTLKLHMDKPDAKATQQIFRDEVLLQWSNKSDTITHLVVINALDGKIAFRAQIKPAQQSFQLHKNTLKPGQYDWYVGNKLLKKKLIIEN